MHFHVFLNIKIDSQIFIVNFHNVVCAFFETSERDKINFKFFMQKVPRNPLGRLCSLSDDQMNANDSSKLKIYH